MTHIKSNVLIGFLLLMTLGIASADNLKGEHSHIQVKEKKVQGMPKGSSIQSTINGHTLSVVFLENLGQVNIQVTMADGGSVHVQSTPTLFGVNFYITDTGSYIVTFTLSNGDEYYGEFEVTD